MAREPSPVDAYLAAVPADRRGALERLRRAIHAAAPGAEECLSYRIPAFRVDGEVVAGFLATAKGCSYYPFSGKVLAALAEEVAGYGGTPGSLHFSPEKGLPAGLVRKLVRARRAEVREKGRARKAKREGRGAG
jgi:uncharacterized protein YdhG (YjbR/CyaY superfamily)